MSLSTVVNFDGSGSTDNVGVVSYDWTFVYDGNDEVLTGVNPSFTFDIAGLYTVTLNVSDALGYWDLDTVVIVVGVTEYINLEPGWNLISIPCIKFI